LTRPTYGRPRKLTDEQIAELHAWAAFARSTKDAATRLGISTSTVRVYLRRMHKTERSAA
jgi:transposase